MPDIQPDQSKAFRTIYQATCERAVGLNLKDLSDLGIAPGKQAALEFIKAQGKDKLRLIRYKEFSLGIFLKQEAAECFGSYKTANQIRADFEKTFIGHITDLFVSGTSGGVSKDQILLKMKAFFEHFPKNVELLTATLDELVKEGKLFRLNTVDGAVGYVPSPEQLKLRFPKLKFQEVIFNRTDRMVLNQKILAILSEREATFNELGEQTGIPAETLAEQLKFLTELSIIEITEEKYKLGTGKFATSVSPVADTTKNNEVAQFVFRVCLEGSFVTGPVMSRVRLEFPRELDATTLNPNLKEVTDPVSGINLGLFLTPEAVKQLYPNFAEGYTLEIIPEQAIETFHSRIVNLYIAGQLSVRNLAESLKAVPRTVGELLKFDDKVEIDRKDLIKPKRSLIDQFHPEFVEPVVVKPSLAMTNLVLPKDKKIIAPNPNNPAIFAVLERAEEPMFIYEIAEQAGLTRGEVRTALDRTELRVATKIERVDRTKFPKHPNEGPREVRRYSLIKRTTSLTEKHSG